MNILQDKKGMYEFILTKSVMLIFILGLVGIFYNLYNNLSYMSAADIADSEASRLAKEIDDVISARGVSSAVVVNMKRELKVGRETVSYELLITENGVVVVQFIQAPYQDVAGIAQFGTKLTRDPAHKDKIDCTWRDILNGARLEVEKESSYSYDPSEDKLYYEVHLTLNANGCNDLMKFDESFEER